MQGIGANIGWSHCTVVQSICSFQAIFNTCKIIILLQTWDSFVIRIFICICISINIARSCVCMHHGICSFGVYILVSKLSNRGCSYIMDCNDRRQLTELCMSFDPCMHLLCIMYHDCMYCVNLHCKTIPSVVTVIVKLLLMISIARNF